MKAHLPGILHSYRFCRRLLIPTRNHVSSSLDGLENDTNSTTPKSTIPGLTSTLGIGPSSCSAQSPARRSSVCIRTCLAVIDSESVCCSHAMRCQPQVVEICLNGTNLDLKVGRDGLVVAESDLGICFVRSLFKTNKVRCHM